MTSINLLPWREIKREHSKRQFLGLLAGSCLIVIVFLGLWHVTLKMMVNNQLARNAMLETAINNLEQQIAKLDSLQAKKKQLVERMMLISQLQHNRPMSVHLLAALVEIIPEGVYLTSMQRNEDVITVVGKADSNTSVSEFMNNIATAKWIAEPELNEIQTYNYQGKRISSFKLSFKQVTPGIKNEESKVH